MVIAIKIIRCPNIYSSPYIKSVIYYTVIFIGKQEIKHDECIIDPKLVDASS